MAVRTTPEEYFFIRKQVNIPMATQQPIPVINLETTPAQTTALTVDPNLIIFGIVAIVGIIGLLAFFGSRR